MDEVTSQVSKLVRMSVAFHNLNKDAETQVGLSLVQYHVMSTLRDMPGTSPQELAKAVGVHPSTLTQSMKYLLNKGYLFASENPKDSRKKILSITLEGKEQIEKFDTQFNSLLKNSRGVDREI